MADATTCRKVPGGSPAVSVHDAIGSAGADGAFRAVVARGGVYWVDLDKRRPCVAVSSDDVLGVDVRQTYVVPITSNVARAGIAGNVLLPGNASGLPTDSVAVPLGLELIDRSLLGTRAGKLPRILIDDIDEGLRAILGI